MQRAYSVPDLRFISAHEGNTIPAHSIGLARGVYLRSRGEHSKNIPLITQRFFTSEYSTEFYTRICLI